MSCLPIAIVSIPILGTFTYIFRPKPVGRYRYRVGRVTVGHHPSRDVEVTLGLGRRVALAATVLIEVHPCAFVMFLLKIIIKQKMRLEKKQLMIGRTG